MSQALAPAVGSKVGRYSLTAESPEALAASSFIGRGDDGQLARVFLVARAGTDADAVQRAASQAKTLAHANVLRLFEVEAAEGRLALVFEHAEGVSLLTLVTAAAAAGLSQKVAMRIGLDVLEGLAAAHAAGLAHGELGPHLVWIGADGRARVAGTGVARGLGKALGPKTQSDRLAYIAPERVKAASTGGAPAADAKADVFSAAVLLWELLAKQRLFAGRLESAVIQKVLTAPVAPLASIAEDIPDGVDEALHKAMDRDPARRAATARELCDALTAAAGDDVATHAEVAAVVADLAKKPLEEMRARLTSAGALSASGELVVPPARPSFPTLDDSFVEADDTTDGPAPVVRVPPKPPPAPPKAAPKPIAKPGDLKAPTKPIEVKVATPKPPEAKGADAKAADAKADAKAADAKADAKGADAKGADAKGADAKEPKAADSKPADAKAADAKPDSKPGDADAAKADDAAKSAPGAKEIAPPNSDTKISAVSVPAAVPGAPKAGAGAAARVPIVSVGSKKPLAAAVPRKGTLLGMAPPGVLAAAKAGADSSPKPPVAADKPADAAAADSAKADAAKADAPKTDAAKTDAAKPEVAEAAAPASKTPPQGSPVKAAEPASIPLVAATNERTPSSSGGAPHSTGRRPALTGALQPGDALGRYELLLPVASGGMAAVWAARLQGTAGFQKTVAIKTMLPGMSADADFEEMFLDEARVAARIRHPNVVEIFDLGEEGETLYLVMEWVDGETFGHLQKGAKGHGGIPMPILLRLASQACAGLHAAHELRDDKGALVDLVHRDISPANLLVSKTGFVKIVDFGVAKSKARMYTTRVGGMIKGKTPYLSPEQLAAQPIDRRSDIYSFGAVLYVMATGLHPFRGETEAKTIENIALRDPVSLRKIDPAIHADFEAIVLKALAKDPAQRFQTASEMQRALDTLAASIGTTVNDDDVAAFVKKVTGDSLEKRTTALRDAIATADAGKQPIQPRAASTPDSHAPPSGKDAEKVDIDDVDISDESVEDAKAKPKDAAKPGDAKAKAIPPPPMPGADMDAAFNAASLGSDEAPASPPVDTLAAASTDPTDDADLAPQRKRKPMMIVGAVLGVCALIGIIAVASSGGDKPSASGSAHAAANGPEAQRTGQQMDTPPPVTAAPATATATETPAATATAEPTATATATATAEPTPTATATAEPVADATPTKPVTGTKTTAPVKTAAPTKTAAPVKTTKPPTKPPGKREFNTL